MRCCALFMPSRVRHDVVLGESQEADDAKLWPWLHLDLILDDTGTRGGAVVAILNLRYVASK